MEMNILQNIQIKLREKIVLSDFYIFLEDDKHLPYEEIKNLSIDEINKYLDEYIKLEKDLKNNKSKL